MTIRPLGPIPADLKHFVHREAKHACIEGAVELLSTNAERKAFSMAKHKVIYIQSNLAQSYGRTRNILYAASDGIPVDEIGLHCHFQRIMPSDRRMVKFALANFLTDLEIEALMLHELGHVSHEHETSHSLGASNHRLKAELEADEFALRTEKGQSGLIRYLRREIVIDYLNRLDAVQSEGVELELRYRLDVACKMAISRIFNQNRVSFTHEPRLKLMRYLEEQASKVGLGGKIQLTFIDTLSLAYCDVTRKIITVSNYCLKRYGNEDTLIELLIDQLPCNPQKIDQFVSRLSPMHFYELRKTLSLEPTDIELESIVVHEIGHIVARHSSHKGTNYEAMRREELEADRFAYKTDRGRKGFIRSCKRKILYDLLYNKEWIGGLVTNVRPQQMALTHPCFEFRLEMAVSVEDKQ
jgi:hypothetical protein